MLQKNFDILATSVLHNYFNRRLIQIKSFSDLAKFLGTLTLPVFFVCY